jgi:hypothetical protein
MQYKIKDIKQLIVLISLLGLLGSPAFSQGTDMGLERRPGPFLGITMGSVRPQLISTSDLETTETNLSGSKTFSGTLDIGYYISKYFGLKTGIGYSSYNADLALNSYQDGLYLKDSENESYELRVTASGISESQILSVMTIPLNVVINIPVSGLINIFAEPGFNLTIPVKSDFTNIGLFTYKGYYPEYNVVLENLPNHGFATNSYISTDDDLELKKVWFDATVYSGINFAVKPNFHISTGIVYSRSLSNISGYESADEYQLSSAPGQVNSLMGGAEKVTTKAFGFSVGIRYFINR